VVGVLGGKLPPFWNSAGKLHFTIGGIRESLPWSQYHLSNGICQVIFWLCPRCF
jgi:hypothetical protein